MRKLFFFAFALLTVSTLLNSCSSCNKSEYRHGVMVTPEEANRIDSINDIAEHYKDSVRINQKSTESTYTSDSKPFTPETSEAFDRSLLFVKHHVEGRLKYPAESDFDAYSVSKEELYPNVFRVKGDLNTKNGFGVTVTMKYDYIVEFLGGDVESSNNWRIEKSNLK